VICAACTAETADRPCAKCGAQPWLFERYRYEARLGTGSSGTTWRAIDTRDGRTVAVKDVPLSLATDKQVALVEREVRVLRELDHPAIPRYIAHGVEGARRTRRLVMVESFVDGEALPAPMSEVDALDVLEQLTMILAYLHGLRPPVVHRDVKPSNVIRRRDRRIALVDFGSVRDSLPGTLSGSTVAGTFGYMAPEQFRGEAVPASDWYGLGALGWWLLTGIEPRTRMGDSASEFSWRKGLVASPGMMALLAALLDPDPQTRLAEANAVRVMIHAARWGVPVALHGGVLWSLYEDVLAFGTPTGMRTGPRRGPVTDAAVIVALNLAWIVPVVCLMALLGMWW
jgi:serine/threonine protein kinase